MTDLIGKPQAVVPDGPPFLGERNYVRSFVRNLAVSVASQPPKREARFGATGLRSWIEEAILRKLMRDAESMYTGMHFDVATTEDLGGLRVDMYHPKSGALVLFRVVGKDDIAVRQSLGEIPSEEVVWATRCMGELRASGRRAAGAAIAHIPLDSNNTTDIWVASCSPEGEIGAPAQERMRRLAHKMVMGVIMRPSARGQQKMPGTSDLGNPCDVCLANKIGVYLGVQEPPERGFSLKAWVGTAIHERYEQDLPGIYDHGKTEITVEISEVPGLGLVSGHVDVYLPDLLCLNDYKSSELQKMRKFERFGVPQAYISQTMLYAYGLRRSGHAIKYVSLTFIPRDSADPEDILSATAPYKESEALLALERARKLVDVVRSDDTHTLKPDLETPCFTCVILPKLKKKREYSKNQTN